ncbi:hypothetical protein N7481_010215 [Penicillium waksmanii]|uniref:uncharacterized protein n=1 Tax=Penicillium waksmanii TaxID=69791 RepID=UPI0025470AD2|nr:uncharacterized protein N7481_010215 [Penicillium waksmanii]KAJ5976508.1 hypothetical protein N7481_010215 [Penicillium waksmanii]
MNSTTIDGDKLKAFTVLLMDTLWEPINNSIACFPSLRGTETPVFQVYQNDGTSDLPQNAETAVFTEHGQSSSNTISLHDRNIGPYDDAIQRGSSNEIFHQTHGNYVPLWNHSQRIWDALESNGGIPPTSGLSQTADGEWEMHVGPNASVVNEHILAPMVGLSETATEEWEMHVGPNASVVNEQFLAPMAGLSHTAVEEWEMHVGPNASVVNEQLLAPTAGLPGEGWNGLDVYRPVSVYEFNDSTRRFSVPAV